MAANDDGIGTEGTSTQQALREARARARELRESALRAVEGTPPWAWAVVAGVVLLVAGALIAVLVRRNRARVVDIEA